MSIISEQVKELRDVADGLEAMQVDYLVQKTLRSAADTIEALSAKVRESNMSEKPTSLDLDVIRRCDALVAVDDAALGDHCVDMMFNHALVQTVEDIKKRLIKIPHADITPQGDLISRQDAIDAIYEHEFSNWCDKDEVSDVLYSLPSADAIVMGTPKAIEESLEDVEPWNPTTSDLISRQTSRWVKGDDEEVYCENCLNPAEINCITGEFMESPYCSECGCKMVGDLIG